jgi:hypothetical protein
MSTAFKQRKPAKATQTVWVDRWSPPKPLVGLQAIEKVLNRHTVLVTPESRLVVAVIARAIGDCLSLSVRPRREARRFVLGDGLGLWCDLVGLHPDFVRFVARKAGYLADEKAHWQKVPIKVPVPPDTCLPETVITTTHETVRSSAAGPSAPTPLNPFGETTHA